MLQKGHEDWPSSPGRGLHAGVPRGPLCKALNWQSQRTKIKEPSKVALPLIKELLLSPPLAMTHALLEHFPQLHLGCITALDPTPFPHRCGFSWNVCLLLLLLSSVSASQVSLAQHTMQSPKWGPLAHAQLQRSTCNMCPSAGSAALCHTGCRHCVPSLDTSPGTSSHPSGGI